MNVSRCLVSYFHHSLQEENCLSCHLFTHGGELNDVHLLLLPWTLPFGVVLGRDKTVLSFPNFDHIQKSLGVKLIQGQDRRFQVQKGLIRAILVVGAASEQVFELGSGAL